MWSGTRTRIDRYNNHLRPFSFAPGLNILSEVKVGVNDNDEIIVRTHGGE